MKLLFQLFIRLHVFLFRMTGGRFGSKVKGLPIMLLNTVGRKSGRERTRPLVYLQDGDAYIVVASAGGQDKNPGWYFNLKARPKVSFELGNGRQAAHAIEADMQGRQNLWPKIVEKGPFYDDYQRNTTREIPVIILRPENEMAG